MGEPVTDPSPAHANTLEQLKLHLDIYKTHFDMFLKGTALYFAALGAIAGFLYRDGASRQSQIALSCVVVGGSITFLVACVAARAWVRELALSVRKAEEKLAMDPFPFSGAIGVIGAMIAGCALFIVFGVVSLWLALVR